MIAGALGVSVVPAMATPFASTVAGCPAAVIIGAGLCEGAGLGRIFFTVEVPRTRSPFDWSATGVPETAVGSAPATMD